MPISKGEVSYTYDASKLLEDVPEDDREDATYEAGEAALQKIHEYMENERSPVAGNRKKFEALKNDGYKAYKKSKVGNQRPNLMLTGNMIESMEVDADDSSFTISVEGTKEKLKAYNHNKGDTVTKRQFMPEDNQKFKGDIVKVIKKTIAKYKKPKREIPDEATPPTEIATDVFGSLFESFKATQREQDIAKNIKLFKLEDIL